MKKDGINSQAFFNIMSQIVLNGTNFVLVMVFTRFLSTENYGIVSIYQAYLLFIAAIVGLNVQGTIGPAFVHIDEKEQDSYLYSILLLALGSLLVILVIVILFIKQISNFTQLSPILIFLMVFHGYGVFCFNFISIKYVYLKKSQNTFVISFLLSIMMIVFSFLGMNVLENLIPDYYGRIIGLALPYIICSIFSTLSIFKRGIPSTKKIEYWKFCIPICLPLMLHGISQIVLSQTDKIMIQKLLSDASIVGIYSFIVTFVHVLNSTYTALNNTWVPIYYDYIKNNDNLTLCSRAKKYNNFFTYLVFGFILLAPEVVKIFADNSYWKGIYLIPLVALATYFVFLYSFAVNYEIYHKKTKLIAIGTTASAVCNILLNLLLIPKYKATGAAVATLLSYLLLFVFHEICARKISDNEYMFTPKFYYTNIFKILVSVCIFYLFIDFAIIRWVLAVLIGFKILYELKLNKSLF